jgi:hypothetical protein
MKTLLKIALLGFFACLSGWAQCGPSGHLIFNPISGLYDCTANAGAGTGTVTSVGLVSASTARLTVTGASPILASGTWTIDIANPFVFPGTTTFQAGTTSISSFNVPSGVSKTSPASGDFWNQSGVLHFYDGSTDQSLLFQGRTISTTSPLAGGGALTSNLTLTCLLCTTNAGALNVNQLVIGAGGQATAALGDLGTTTTLYHGNAVGPGSFGNVADGDFGTNILGVAHGGTNLASGTSGGVLCYTGATTLAASAALTANLPLIGGGAGVCPSVGTKTGTGTLFVTSEGAQTNTALVSINANSNHIASPATINNSTGDISTPGTISAGVGSGDTTAIKYSGVTSGGLIMTVNDVAGTLAGLVYANPTGATVDTFLRMHGSTTCPTNTHSLFTGVTCYAVDFASPTGSGTVNSGTGGQFTYYAANGTAVSGNANATISGGTVTLGVAGATQGELDLAGSGGGQTKLVAQASGGGTATIPAGSFTFAGTTLALGGTNAALTAANGGVVYSTASALAITAAGTAKQLLLSGGAGAPTMADLTDVKIIPAANCNNATAGAGWDIPASNAPTVACRAGTNNLGGVLQWANNNTTTNAQFSFELPGDWDTAAQPYVSIYYGSGANTSGTVKWTFSTACSKGDGSVSDDPAFNAESATGGKTMAVANRMWAENVQFTALTSGNNCIAGSNVVLKITSGNGTATSTVNVSKIVLTIPRLLTVQAN